MTNAAKKPSLIWNKQDCSFDMRDELDRWMHSYCQLNNPTAHIILIQERRHFSAVKDASSWRSNWPVKARDIILSIPRRMPSSKLSNVWNLEGASELQDGSNKPRKNLHLPGNLNMSSRPNAKLHFDKFLFFPILYTSLVTAVNEFPYGWIWPSLQVQSVIFSYHRPGWQITHQASWPQTPNIYKCGLYLSPWPKTEAISTHTDYLERWDGCFWMLKKHCIHRVNRRNHGVSVELQDSQRSWLF